MVIDFTASRKFKEIVGDSTGREAALKIAEWISKNSKYEYYYDDYKERI